MICDIHQPLGGPSYEPRALEEGKVLLQSLDDSARLVEADADNILVVLRLPKKTKERMKRDKSGAWLSLALPFVSGASCLPFLVDHVRGVNSTVRGDPYMRLHALIRIICINGKRLHESP